MLIRSVSEGNTQKLAKVVAEAISQRLRCLTEELVPISLRCNNLNTEEKQHLVLILLQLAMKNMHEEMTPQKSVFPYNTENSTQYDLLGNRSVLLFQRLKFTIDDM